MRKLLHYRTLIKDKSQKTEFENEVTVSNFHRVKYFGYFLLIMAIGLVVSDFFFSDFWATHQVSLFLVMDILALVAAIIILLISHYYAPENTEDAKKWHKIYFQIYLIYHLTWATIISIIEAETSNSVPTYLVGIFAAATIYLHMGFLFLLYLSISLVSLILGLHLNGHSIPEIVTQYSSTFILVLIAWGVAEIIINTHRRSFIKRKEIETTRDSLEYELTIQNDELRHANEKLLNEISERQKYERSLEREKKKVEEADRLKSVFLANMSHEIRTPLNGIIGFGDLLKTPNLTDEKKKRYIQIIRNNGQQLLKLIDDLMDISMIESNQLKLNIQQFRVSYLFPDAEVFFKDYVRLNGKNHLIIINDGISGNESDTLESDSSRVQQVLYNLLSNATKFTHEGFIRFGGKIEDGYALIYVEDSGIGITKESSATIFKRFRQGEESASRTYGGTGLGLSISEGIIELLGGMIWADLSYKKGARFCFSLPTVQAGNNLPENYLNKSIKFIQKKALFITDTLADKPIFFDHLITSMQLNIKQYSLPKLSKKDLKSSKLLFLDLNDTKAIHDAQAIRSLKGSESKIIALIDPNPERKEALYDLGCYLVYTNPVNINLLLHKIYTEIIEPS